jgi:trigger factor
MGDTANIDFDGYLEGERFDGGKAEGYELELGSNSFVPGFEEQIVGMNIGEEKDLDITFPENYTPDLAGKAVVFKVKLNALTAAELPEMDDEFAKDVSEFDTIEEYKANLRENLLKNRTSAAENEFRTEIIKQAVNNVTADIPECMINEKLEETLRTYAGNFGLTDPSITAEQLMAMFGLTDEAIENNMKPAAEFQVRTDLLLNAIIETEELGDTEEAFEAYVAKVAGEVNTTPEQLREYFGEDYIKAEFKKELATNLMIDSAVVKAAE